MPGAKFKNEKQKIVRRKGFGRKNFEFRIMNLKLEAWDAGRYAPLHAGVQASDGKKGVRFVMQVVLGKEPANHQSPDLLNTCGYVHARNVFQGYVHMPRGK